MKSTSVTKVGFLAIAIAVFAVSCSDNSPTNSQNPSPSKQTYPTMYAPLSQDSLDVMQNMFVAANPGVCGGLDEFGFTTAPLCLIQARGVSANFNPDLIADQARDFLIRNSQFTGVTDISELEVISLHEIRFNNGDLKALSLTFESQIVEGLRVYHPAIRVIIDSLGATYVLGNHFPDIIVPLTKTTPDNIKEGLIEHKIVWFDFRGKPREFIIDDDSFCANPIDSDSSIEFEKVIFPFQTEQGIELRVTWKVDVGGCGETGGTSKWTLYVDVVSGELIFTAQNFFTLGASPQ